MDSEVDLSPSLFTVGLSSASSFTDFEDVVDFFEGSSPCGHSGQYVPRIARYPVSVRNCIFVRTPWLE
jgi:hypothetical protein